VASRLREIGAAFVKLGLTSFGGPVAHLGYLRTELVTRRRWVDEARYAELVALCQLLPGPTSSQVGFALGLQRGGVVGGLLAWLCFTAPSAVIMIAFALGAGRLEGGWLHGLAIAAVAIVAHAVVGMARSLCFDLPRAAIAIGAGAILLVVREPLLQVGVIAVGAAVGAVVLRPDVAPVEAGPRARAWTIIPIAVAISLLAILPVLAHATGAPLLARADSCYRAGSLVFGGGHVVLPLLRAELVTPGWLDDATFLAGYSGAQALPGPLFAFAGFVGAASLPGPYAALAGGVCVVAIFLPGLLLVAGALPHWEALRAKPRARAAFAGTNAAVVGILAAALVSPIGGEALVSFADVVAAILALALLFLRVPSWVVVGGLAAAGQLLLTR